MDSAGDNVTLEHMCLLDSHSFYSDGIELNLFKKMRMSKTFTLK